MRRALPQFRRFLSKFTFEIIPAVLASVAAGATLTYLHLGRPADSVPAQSIAAVNAGDAQSTQSQRELTRQILKTRRESAETPAQVIPRPERDAIAALAAAPVGDTAPAAASVPVGEPKPRPKDIASRAVAPAPAASEPAPAAASPIVIGEPIVVTAPRDADMQAPPAPGPVGAVFSAVSILTGKAVNATGDTLSWVVELPGRIVSTGGKLLEKSAPPPPAPRREAL